jgi:hypothetical protein
MYVHNLIAKTGNAAIVYSYDSFIICCKFQRITRTGPFAVELNENLKPIYPVKIGRHVLISTSKHLNGKILSQLYFIINYFQGQLGYILGALLKRHLATLGYDQRHNAFLYLQFLIM